MTEEQICQIIADAVLIESASRQELEKKVNELEGEILLLKGRVMVLEDGPTP